MISAHRSLAFAMRAVTLLLMFLGAVALGRIALTRNIDRACALDEWPHLSSCRKADTAVSAQVRELQQQASRNPGDSANYLALAMLTTRPGGIAPLDDQVVLDVASQLTRQDPMLQRVLAARALQGGQWPQSVGALARLVDDFHDPAAAQAMASLLAFPESRQALVDAIKPESRWVGPVLQALPAARVPVTQVMPLLDTALAMNLIGSEQGLALIGQLKAAGAWLDAQALWLRLLGQGAPLLFNGGFEQGFVRGGFDWELPDGVAARTGVQVQQPPVAGANGRALELAFNGRPLALPVMSQQMVLLPGRYAFSGRFMARRLRAGAGMTWVFGCTSSAAELARTTPLSDTQGRWQQISLPLSVPDGCGAVQVQLRTQLGSDALSGLRGEAYFDDFQVVAL